MIVANNLLTTADIQRINEEEDAFDQILQEKVLEAQTEQLLQEEKLKEAKEEGEHKAKIIGDLKNEINNMAIQFQIERNRHSIEKYKRDISDKLREKEEALSELKVYKNLLEFEKHNDMSTSRYTLILIIMPIITILFFYVKHGAPFLKPLLLSIDRMTGFTQDMLVWMIPIALTVIYYIGVSMWLGRAIAPSELFEKFKLKVLNIRIKKYMRKNNIALSYLETDRRQKTLSLESAIKNYERNIKSLEKKIEEIKGEIHDLEKNRQVQKLLN